MKFGCEVENKSPGWELGFYWFETGWMYSTGFETGWMYSTGFETGWMYSTGFETGWMYSTGFGQVCLSKLLYLGLNTQLNKEHSYLNKSYVESSNQIWEKGKTAERELKRNRMDTEMKQKGNRNRTERKQKE